MLQAVSETKTYTSHFLTALTTRMLCMCKKNDRIDRRAPLDSDQNEKKVNGRC
jgi:hypothetical protein